MLKKNKVLAALIMMLVIVLSAGIVLAAVEISNIESGQTFEKDWFAANQSVKNEGTIKGDMIAAGADIISTGKIEGDLIVGAANITVSGEVLGDIRSAGGVINLDGRVGKNVNMAGATINIKNNSKIDKNLYVFGEDVKIDGKVRGYTKLGAKKIVLSGEFSGDVDVNMEEVYDSSTTPTLTVLPGTVIQGTLNYKGAIEADIKEGANVKNFNWTKAPAAVKNNREHKNVFNLWHFIKMLIATVIYFLISMAFYKGFPDIFRRQGDVISKQPLNVVGVGLIALISVLGILILFIILLLLTALLASPSAVLILGGLVASIYLILFYFSSVPVSLWVGNILLKDRYSLPVRYGTGLTIITLTLYSIKLMSNIPGPGFLFTFLMVVTALAVQVVGIGAILFLWKDILSVIRRHRMVEEDNI